MDILRTTIVAGIVLAAPLHTADGQVRRIPSAPSPRLATWGAASGALMTLGRFNGGAEGEEWAWGDGLQLRGALEQSLRRDIAVGIVGTYARLPITVLGGSCNGCRGDGVVWQALASARLGGGGGIGFHSVLEGVAGITGFGPFSRGRDESSVPGEPTSAAQSMSPTIGVSYGVGYTINPGFEVNFGQDIGLIFYDVSDLAPAGAAGRPQFRTTRLTLRYAFGQ